MTATYDGIGRTDQWVSLRRRERRGTGRNVGRRERLISGLAAAAVAAYGLRRRRGRNLLLPIAGALIGRAVSGRCAVNGYLGRNTALDEERSSPAAVVGPGEGVRVDLTVLLNRPRAEVYRFWRNLENLPRFMDHLESVSVLDGRRSHWVAKGPAGSRVEWDAEIFNEIPNQLIAWRSLPGSEVDHAGSVHFTPTDIGDTEVRVVLRYDPPAGKLGAAVARLFGEEPSQQVAEDLRRLKQVVEAAEAG
jgi:uncharacterized membrane protein